MKNSILLILLLFSTSSSAALEIAPGLWKYKHKTKIDGKIFDPQEQMKKALAAMTPEQKKMMQGMMNNMGQQPGMPSVNLIKSEYCLTKDKIARNEFDSRDNTNCSREIKKQTRNELVFETKCPNQGTAHFRFKRLSSKKYKMHMTGQDNQGRKVELDYTATHVSNKCSGA